MPYILRGDLFVKYYDLYNVYPIGVFTLQAKRKFCLKRENPLTCVRICENQM